MIQGHGSLSAKVIFIADGATDEDLSSGYALSGRNERQLAGFCHANGINFQETYRTLLIKERVNLSKPMANLPLMTDQYKEILTNEIKHIKPNIIVPLSELSFNFSAGLSGIRKFRGSVLPSKTEFGQIRVIPILGNNPYINEDPKVEFISRLDFGKITKNLDCKGPIPEYGRCWIVQNTNALREFINRHYTKCTSKSIAAGGFLNIDIETYIGIPTCISLCFDGIESCTVPFLDRRISIDERMLMMHEVSILLADKRLPKVNQNIKYDWHHLEKALFKVNNIAGDTMIAAQILNCEFDKDLGFLNSLYTDMPYFKDEGKEFDPNSNKSDQLYLYCAKDSLSTHQIQVQQIAELHETNTFKVYEQSMAILPIYKKMEDIGIRIDMERRALLHAKYDSKFEIEVYKFQHLVNEKANPLSDKQVGRIVYEDLGYKKIRGVKTTKAGNPATDEESLEMLMWMGFPENALGRDAKSILKSVINCRKLHKVLEYLESELHPDQKAHCSSNIAGAETGRTTTSKTTDYYFLFKGKAINKKNLGRSFQNIGKHGFEIDGETLGQDLRSMFVPAPGYVFVECDLSQAEARVDAVLAKDYDILGVFDGPIGIHHLTGSWLYDCPPEEIKKHVLVDGVDRYHEAKTARHAGERNMKEDRLMMMINRPIKECSHILRTFHEKQPNIREVFHREVRESIQKTRHLHAPNGRMRNFFGRFDNHMINEGISYLPQAIVTDYLKSAIRKIFVDSDIKNWAQPLSEAHDGFLVQVPIGRHEEYSLAFKTAAEVPIDFRTCSLPREFELTIPCEREWSDTNWSNMKEIK